MSSKTYFYSFKSVFPTNLLETEKYSDRNKEEEKLKVKFILVLVNLKFDIFSKFFGVFDIFYHHLQ